MSGKKKQKPKGPLPPKIPAFDFSLRNRTTKAAKNRAKVLTEKYGVKFGFSLREKLTPQRKAAITRVTRKYSGYLNPKNRFKFIHADKATLRAVRNRGDIAPSAQTKTGVFVQAPKSRKRVRIKIRKSGEIVAGVGRRVSSYALFKSVDVVKDPKIIAREAKKRKASHVLINIKGFASKKVYTIGAWQWYLENVLVPDIEEGWEDPEVDTAFRKHLGVEFVTFK